jgi:hypothetical protein
VGALLSLSRRTTEPFNDVTIVPWSDGPHGRATALQRARLYRFVRRHGEQRITKPARDWLQTVDRDLLNRRGRMLLLAMRGSQLLGLLGFERYGLDVLFVVVHRDARGRRIARRLILEALRKSGRLYARVATDNTASLRTFLRSGLVGIALERGLTGKPTLVLAGGQWHRDELQATYQHQQK